MKDAQRVAANGIEIAYETFGRRGDPPLVMVMGLGTQMLAWPDEMCAQLADRGHFVVRFDNRDVGLSTHLHGTPAPSPIDVVVRRRQPPYTIADMARDTLGLTRALQLGPVHLVGASMGGFIAQAAALIDPARVRTLTLIMTSTGSKRVGNPHPRLFTRLTQSRVVADRASAQQRAVEAFRIIGSRGYAFDEDYLAELAGKSFDRSHDPDGYWRQLAAIAAQPNRSALLPRLVMPALVLHGLHDPLVNVSGGLALARLLPNATFVGYSGMGHDLPRELWPSFTDHIVSLTGAAPVG